MCDLDGELFVKPCHQQEIDFYESAENEHPDFYRWMPQHFGTLHLNAATDIADLNKQLGPVAGLMTEHMKEEVVEFAHTSHVTDSPASGTPAASTPATSTSTPAPATPAEPAGDPKQQQQQASQPVSISSPWAPGRNTKLKTETSIVLDNAAYGFSAPNIMDCKLGTRLWADDAPAEKKKRFDAIAADTTHRSHGFRVAGMRAYKGSADPAELDAEDYRKYDKDWGRFTVTAANIVESMRRFVFNPSAGVADEDARFVCDLFLEDLKEVERMLSREESRMYSASLLFVAEGDGEALALAIREAKAAAAVASAAAAAAEERENGGRLRKAAKTSEAQKTPNFSSNRVDSGIGMGEDDVEVYTEGAVVSVDELLAGGGGDSDDSGDADSDDDGDGKRPKERKIYSLRLIDFAHAEWVPGQGPDENVLFGVRSLIDIFRQMSQSPAKATS
ncbi:hypothetical protein GGTG_09084 [Gaeumannomyces tritici R3-111a-1]|uniref:Kinase n=1 Tax=Gaeumannomyces tritici (strain R3-111a-1) TaxID=644352 RepID=J3P6E4_GAET3|nr:hypothetical protein GGTG_09084 [Gaeumannomyces tritici R3-111a-1]EJT72218.1 hypothetical protein GGTG_09084 [Gaeumannomyces tritici R3-111a-1]